MRALLADRTRFESTAAALNGEVQALQRDAPLSDPATGLKSRRFFATTIEGDIDRARRLFTRHDSRRKNRDLVFYLVDIDSLREVNEQFGQKAGDRIVAEIASRVLGQLRKADSIIRWGGEEFLLVCRNCDRTEARVVADRILLAVSGELFDLGEGRTARRSCSIGWTPYPWLPEAPDAVGWEDILRLAERALALAKKSGRNQAVGLTATGVGDDSLLEARAAIENPLKSGDWRAIRLIRSVGREEKTETSPAPRSP